MKIELVNSVIQHTAIGYISTIATKTAFENIYGQPIVDWADSTTLPLEDYFISNSTCYLLDSVNSLPEGLSLISNLETLS